MEASQRDELELVAHLAKLLLEASDGRFVQLLAPVEGRRAVICQQFAGELRMDRLSEATRLLDIRLRGFAPDEVGIRRVGQAARNSRLDASADTIEALSGALARQEGVVALVNVAGDELGAVGVCACHQNRR